MQLFSHLIIIYLYFPDVKVKGQENTQIALKDELLFLYLKQGISYVELKKRNNWKLDKEEEQKYNKYH